MKSQIKKESDLTGFERGVKYTFRCVLNNKKFTGSIAESLITGFVLSGVDHNNVKCHLRLSAIRDNKWELVHKTKVRKS